MPSAQPLQLQGIEALRPERNPRNPRPTLSGWIPPLVGAGVCLERDLGVGGQAEPPTDEVDDSGERGRVDERRRPPADVQGIQRRPLDGPRRPE